MTDNGVFDTGDMHNLHLEIDRQPQWRPESSRCADYYDGKQISLAMKRELDERGQPVMVHNLVAPAVDGVLGMEAKTRQGMMVKADDDQGTEVAEALNEKMNEIGRLIEIDRCCSDAFAPQTKAGMGWVEVNEDKLGDVSVKANTVHRNEIWWDWNSKQPDLSDARWLMRKRWLDEDEAIAFFPGHEELIRQACGAWANFAHEAENVSRPSLVSAYQEYTDYDWHDDEIYDTDRRRIRCYEIWYRKFVKGYMLKIHENGREVKYDENNNFHRALITAGAAKLVSRPFKKMYRAYYLGPHKVVDGPSMLPHGGFPYTPFWGYREDGTGIPYGIIRRMLSPQDEYNFRRSKLTYLLNYKRIEMDSDATEMSDQDLIDEVHRANGLIKLNPERRNREGHKAFNVESDAGLAQQQFVIMQDAKQMIQDAAGIYSAMLGQDSNATSGVAINGLIEQGNTTLAELFDNFRYARKQVYEQLLAFTVADIRRDPAEVKVNQDSADPTKTIRLNERVVNEQNVEEIRNDVMTTRMHVVLDDIMSSPGYKAQLTDRMMTLVQSLPPNLQVAVLDLVIENTDVPKKNEILKRIRKLTGQNVDPAEMSDEERKALEARQQKESLVQQLELAEMQKKIDNLAADTERKLAAARKDDAAVVSSDKQDDQTEAQTLKILAELKQLTRNLEASAFQNAGYVLPEMATDPGSQHYA